MTDGATGAHGVMVMPGGNAHVFGVTVSGLTEQEQDWTSGE